MKKRLFFVTLICAASAHAAPTAWLNGTILEGCQYCATDAFHAERKKIANQVSLRNDLASAMGYVVTIDRGIPFVWGRAALVGTGNIIRTDAHVLFHDSGELRFDKVYFEPMQHRGESNLIEIDLSSVQYGGVVGSLQTDVRHDWAIARLREDVIEKFNGDRVFAFLWNYRLTHNEMVRDDYMRATAYVLSHDVTLGIYDSCQKVTDDQPSNYAFGVEEIFFIRCPTEYTQVGSSGSAVAIGSVSDTWSLGGQIIATGMRQLSQLGPTGSGQSPRLEHQMFLGNPPMMRQTLNWFYLQELARRGLDPRKRLADAEVRSETDQRRNEESIMAVFAFLDWQYQELPADAPEIDQIGAAQRVNFARFPSYLKVWEDRKNGFDPGFVRWHEENVVNR